MWWRINRKSTAKLSRPLKRKRKAIEGERRKGKKLRNEITKIITAWRKRGKVFSGNEELRLAEIRNSLEKMGQSEQQHSGSARE